MGYSTDFTGELKFTTEMTASQLALLQAFFCEDARDHPEWDSPPPDYIDLALTKAYDGIRWSGAEKTRGLVEAVNFITREMRKRWPDFGLTGQLNAQGEDFEDRWTLVVGEDGMAKKVKVPIVGQRVTCPHCGEKFVLEAGA